MQSEGSLTIRHTVCVPVLLPLKIEEEPPIEIFWNTIEELEAMSGIDFDIKPYICKNFRVERLSEFKASKLFGARRIKGSSNLRRRTLILGCSADITINDFKCEFGDGSIPPFAERRDLHIQASCEYFAEKITQLFIITQLAKPGVTRAREMLLFVERQFLKETECVLGHLGEMRALIQERRWPTILDLPIRDVWGWANQLDSFKNGFGHTKAGRALCAFTHLLTRHDGGNPSIFRLFWSMIGLEALYCHGTNDLSQQLDEKTQVFLGERKDFKKAVKQMYNYRSRFVHGDIPFPSAYFLADAMPEYEQFADEAFDSATLASAVLVASLQELAKRRWKSLSFSYSVNDPPEEEV